MKIIKNKKINMQKINQWFFKIVAISYLAIPGLVLAQDQPSLRGLKTFVADAGDIVYSTFYVLAGIAFIVFFWGLIQFIAHSSEEKARTDGKKMMLWGIIALFVMFSIVGIINLIRGSLSFTGSAGLPASDFLKKQ